MKLLKQLKIRTCYILLVWITITQFKAWSQAPERPFIMVKASEREKILDKIEKQDWANEIYTNLQKETNKQVEIFYKNPEAYIKQLPFNWAKKNDNNFPPF